MKNSIFKQGRNVSTLFLIQQYHSMHSARESVVQDLPMLCLRHQILLLLILLVFFNLPLLTIKFFNRQTLWQF
jgi:hypothetical protein